LGQDQWRVALRSNSAPCGIRAEGEAVKRKPDPVEVAIGLAGVLSLILMAVIVVLVL